MRDRNLQTVMQNEASLVAGKSLIVWQHCSRQRFRLVLEVYVQNVVRQSHGDTCLQTQLASLGQHVVLKLKMNVCYSIEVVWYVKLQHTPYSLKVVLESRTGKRSRCLFRDVAHQSKLARSSKVKNQRLLQQPSCLECKTLCPIVRKLWPKVYTKLHLNGDYRA